MSKLSKVVAAMVLGGMVAGAGQTAGAEDRISVGELDRWQMQMLEHPTESQLALERAGRIMIYADLSEQTVEKALDEQFDRLQSMMFIRIHHATQEGELIVQDDGC